MQELVLHLVSAHKATLIEDGTLVLVRSGNVARCFCSRTFYIDYDRLGAKCFSLSLADHLQNCGGLSAHILSLTLEGDSDAGANAES
jgi:hypothetical protein